MLLMDYPSIRGEDFPYYDKQETWNLLHAYIDSHRKRLIYEYPMYGLQDIIRVQPQCANMSFSENSRYNRLFHQVVNKVG